MRIGQGWDTHRLSRGCQLLIGGVQISYEYGLIGHSDADVLLHAVIDAVLGAAALGDIGTLFPDTDESYRNISSLLLLERTAGFLTQAGYRVVNVDCTVLAARPLLAPYILPMRNNIASALRIAPDAVSVKAKSGNGLPYLAQDEFIQAQAVVLIDQCK